MKMLAHLPEGLSGMRVRFQRTTDARFYAGWVIETESKRLFVRPGRSEGMLSGDRYMVELYAKNYNLLFEATLDEVHGEEASLDLTGTIRSIAPREPVRLQMTDAMCRVHIQGDPFLAQVIDVSPGSLALNSPRPLKPAMVFTLTIETWAGAIDGEGRVIYCKDEPNRPEPFRVAFTFDPHTRAGQTLWAKLFDAAS